MEEKWKEDEYERMKIRNKRNKGRMKSSSGGKRMRARSQ